MTPQQLRHLIRCGLFLDTRTGNGRYEASSSESRGLTGVEEPPLRQAICREGDFVDGRWMRKGQSWKVVDGCQMTLEVDT